jgi:purine-binding chemotaxis protein CheW
MELQLVIFKLGNESFGVEISTVESIIKMQVITRLPQAPEFIEGVTNLRGKILPVIDLRKRLGLNLTDVTKDSRIIVVGLSGTTVGMVVDSVEEVLRINQEIVEPPPSITVSINSKFIQGIAKSGDDLVILLDLYKVLRTTESEELEEVAASLT